MGWITTILGFLSSLSQIISKVLDYFREKNLINQGKALQQAEIAKDEININREQTEILSQDRTKEETIKRLEDGTF